MKVTVIGLGYVGAVTSVCLAHDGNTVFGVDLDSTKIELLRNGKTPVIEEDIEEITSQAAASGNLHVSTELTLQAVEVDILFICVGTPSAPNGSQDLGAILRVCDQIGQLLQQTQNKPAIIVRSTVPAGTTQEIIAPRLEQASNKQAHVDFGLGFQPEFLREGSSVKDFYHPPFTVVGGDEQTVAIAKQLFSTLPGEFVATDIAGAEMLKVTCNAFHALKVTFANEIGRISKSVGLDARHVMQLACMDTQLNISPAYLRPGYAFGGSCLPKDLRALLHLAKINDVDVPMLENVLPSNVEHIAKVAETIYAQKTRKVGLIGLSFKQGTDDLRESPLVALAETLIGKGYDVQIYDQAVNVAMVQGSNRRFVEEVIPHFETLVKSSLDDVLSHADIVVVGHKSAAIESAITAHDPTLQCIVDLVGLDHTDFKAAYHGVCW